MKVDDFYSNQNSNSLNGEEDKKSTFVILIKIEKLYYKKEIPESINLDLVPNLNPGQGQVQLKTQTTKKEELGIQGYLKQKKGIFSSPIYYFILKEFKLYCYEDENSTKLVKEYGLLSLLNSEIKDKSLILNLNQKKLVFYSVKTDESSKLIDLEHWKVTINKILSK